MDEAPDDVEQDRTGEDSRPLGLVRIQIGDAEIAFDVGITGSAAAAAVKGQEAGLSVGEPRGHRNVVLVHREMNECATLEGQKQLAGRGAIVPVLLLGVAKGRAGEPVLQFGRRHRQAVDEQCHVDGVFRALAVIQLPDDREDVGLVAADQCCIQPRGGPEETERKLDTRDQLDTLSKHIERATGLERLLQLPEEFGLGGGRVLGLKLSPFIGLCVFHETQRQRAVDAERPVIILRFPRDISLQGDQPVG